MSNSARKSSYSRETPAKRETVLDEHVSNRHTFVLRTGVATEQQVLDVFWEALRKAEKLLGQKFETRVKINYLTDKEGKPRGGAYLWISNPEVYNMLKGLNPDGTARYDYIEDPDWVDPYPFDDQDPEAEYQLMNEILDAGASWNDLMPPMIRVAHPPLMEFGAYQLSESQMQALRAMDKEKQDKYAENLGGGLYRAKPIQATPAGIKRDPRGESVSSRLVVSRLPEWIKEADLQALFKDYADDNISGRYPVVSIRETESRDRRSVERTGTIDFSPRSPDASFALLMTAVTNYKKGNKSQVLFFGHPQSRY